MKAANRICDKAVQERSDAMEATTEAMVAGKPTVTEERQELVKKAIAPVEKRMVAALRKLEAPSADAGQISKILTGLEKGIEKVESEPDIAFEPVVVTPADNLAEEYGLPECRV